MLWLLLYGLYLVKKTLVDTFSDTMKARIDGSGADLYFTGSVKDGKIKIPEIV